jgi:hypothetical protein
MFGMRAWRARNKGDEVQLQAIEFFRGPKKLMSFEESVGSISQTKRTKT